MFENCKNSKKQGDIGLGAAIGYFSSKGYVVSIPLTDNQDYDLLFDDGIKINKVQVKTTKYKAANKYWQVQLKTSGGNRSRFKDKKFDSSSVEYIFILTDNNDRYLIPSHFLSKCKTHFRIFSPWEKFKI